MSHPSDPQVLISEPEFELSCIDRVDGPQYTLVGDVNSAGAARILEALQAESPRGGQATWMMEEAELTDGPSVTRMVEAARLLLKRHDRLCIVRAPQMLAHSIYRLGMLEGDSGIELIEPREEEGTAS